MLATIHNSPYNNIYKRLSLVEEKNLSTNPVLLVSVEKHNGTKETNGLPFLIFKDETYHYNNGTYYHEKYLEKII